MEFSNELSPQEKTLIMRNTFLENKNDSNTIKNIANYLSENFSKIDGFQYKWNSLITNNPLLFEDVDYVRVKQFINNTITTEEIEAYKRGELRELYATFENMLICNLQYYNRIMNFCTMIFLHYVRISDEEITSKHLDNVIYMLEMTPTQIWCCAMTNIYSTEWELNYAWSINNQNLKLVHSVDKSLIENNWELIYKNPKFAKFIEYSAFRCNTSGFRMTLLSDKTDNKKLSQVCSKFTSTSTALSEEQLNTISDYINEQEAVNKRLYVSINECLLKMFNNDTSQYSIYIFSTEFYIHSTKFSIKVIKQENGRITKEYLANTYECFIAEEWLFNSIRMQIEWAKYVLPTQYEYDKQILLSLLGEMLKENYKKIICFKRMNNYGVVAKITFTGIFNHIYILEELMLDNSTKKSDRKCLSKSNAAKYIIDRGYYIFGEDEEVRKFDELTKANIINHYMNYCVPVMKHMSSIITTHSLLKNDVIDVVCSGKINPHKLNNKNIKYTDMKSGINSKQIMSSTANIAKKQKQSFSTIKKSYWKVIEES